MPELGPGWVVSDQFFVDEEPPEVLLNRLPDLAQVRHAYEHIEERAKGLVRGKPHPDALSGFNFSAFFSDGAVQFGDHRVVIGEQTRELLEQSRAHLIDVVAAASGEIRYNHQEVRFFGDASGGPEMKERNGS